MHVLQYTTIGEMFWLYRFKHGTGKLATGRTRGEQVTTRSTHETKLTGTFACGRKPTPQQITVRMMTVAAKEGLSLNTAAMTSLVTGANGDLRLVLGQLQMLRLRAKALTYDDVRGKMAATKVQSQATGYGV